VCQVPKRVICEIGSVANLADFPQDWACFECKLQIIFTTSGLFVLGFIFMTAAAFWAYFFLHILLNYHFGIWMLFSACTVPVVVEKLQDGTRLVANWPLSI